ncbi:MAG: alpha/beta hydrolase [Isosphaera sp.]|nr:alpha/beta hydrolase [Isosphaera sp.]
MTRRLRRRLLAAAGLVAALWLFTSWLVADQLTRRAAPVRPEPAPAVPWATLRDVRLTAADGETLGAWFAPGRPHRPAVVLLHGNGACRADCLDQAEFLAAEGHPLLLVTLRCHGDSTGDRNDFGRSARHDVVAAVTWLEANGVARPVVWGRSMGAAAALFAARDLGGRVGGYVLECPFRDLRTAVRNRTGHHLPPPLGWLAYTGLSLTVRFVLDDVDGISPLNAAGGVPPDVPALLLAGGADWRAPPAEAEEIAARVGPRAEVVVFPGADHVGLHAHDPTRYRATGLRFLAACATEGRR